MFLKPGIGNLAEAQLIGRNSDRKYVTILILGSRQSKRHYREEDKFDSESVSTMTNEESYFSISSALTNMINQ